MLQDIYFVMVQVSVFIVALPFLIGVVRWKRHTELQRVLFWYFCFLLPLQLVANWLAAENYNNMPFAHLYTVVEFVVLLWIFRSGGRKVWQKEVFWVTLSLFGVWVVVDLIFFESLMEYDAYVRTTEGVFMIILCLHWLVTVMQELRILQLTRTFLFWVSAGLLFYFSGNLLLFIYGEMVLELAESVSYAIWTIHAFLNISLYITYTIALLCPPDQKISSQFS